ncbi:serine/threonine protein kinase [Candidatus Viridilinea mediisalina]|uniref:Protein kinase domain-containing protein n=1 Tax=Candidatus Viridilinea mediisalina TaxID=2024553 RepID=A0A2A6RKF9_9CHLR|nr:serine/threonine-protein kinase [Candidatus Viridilinea mediisalina]PDW03348.1 hypothetical protein CJ255_09185 [Candidatus Viridilinea mediisalina]
MNQNILCPACHQLNAPQTRFCRLCSHDLILNNLGPRYFLTRLIKLREQGAIFEGRDEAGRVYLIKELLDRFRNANERAAALARFQAEVDMLRRLNHPQIPRFHASFDDQGRYYLVLDFIKGEALAELVAREGPLPEAQVLAWATQLCAVLAYLHDQELIYGAMQPTNVLLEAATGNLKLIDFSHATVFQPNVRVSQRGTRGYMPPEQYRGLTTKQSDIYALGATLHHLLSGRPPDPASFAFAPLRTLVPTIAPQSEALVARALELQQAQRFQSIGELRAALVAAQAARAQPAPPPAPVASAQPTPAPAPVAPLPAPISRPPPAPPPLHTPPSTKTFYVTVRVVSLLAVCMFAFLIAFPERFFTYNPPSPPLPRTATPLPGPDTRPIVMHTISYDLILSVDPTLLPYETLHERFELAFAARVRVDYACCDPPMFVQPVFTQGPIVFSAADEITLYIATLEATVPLRGENIPTPP